MDTMTSRNTAVSLPWTLLLILTTSQIALARPYPGITGLAATADSAATASSNPAGIVRFESRVTEAELIVVTSDSTWRSQFGDNERENTHSSSNTVVPTGFFIQPINDDFSFSFTVLGVGFSDDLGDWPGRFIIESYDSVYISAFPSLAYKVNDKLSIAGSLALTYTRFEQERVIANIFDPGNTEGSGELEADGFEVGFGLSTLYQQSRRLRWGLTYQSELDPELDADTSYRGLGPNTERVMNALGIIGGDISINSRSPQSVLGGLYYEFENNHAVTADLAWIDFSNFRLSEFYFNGEALTETEVKYKDIYALAVSYTWPLNDRWMLGVGGFYADDMVDDDQRTMTLRLDSVWSAGIGAEWRWTKDRSVTASLSYIGVGDAPVSTEELPIVGVLEGEFTSRNSWLLRIGVSFGSL